MISTHVSSKVALGASRWKTKARESADAHFDGKNEHPVPPMIKARKPKDPVKYVSPEDYAKPLVSVEQKQKPLVSMMKRSQSNLRGIQVPAALRRSRSTQPQQKVKKERNGAVSVDFLPQIHRHRHKQRVDAGAVEGAAKASPGDHQSPHRKLRWLEDIHGIPRPAPHRPL